jgi:hypothetical protein
VVVAVEDETDAGRCGFGHVGSPCWSSEAAGDPVERLVGVSGCVVDVSALLNDVDVAEEVA